MATSGWQTEKTWFTYSSNVRLIGNIRIDTLTHSGTNLRVKGAIAAGARGSSSYSFYYSDYTSYAQPDGGSKIALGGKGRTWKVGDSDVIVSFDVTLTGVSTSTTSKTFSVKFYGPNTSSVKTTLSWTLTFPASGTAPTGGYVTWNSHTWEKINATTGVSSWGGLSGTLGINVLTGNTNGDASSITSSNWTTKSRRVYRWTNVSTSTLSATGNMTTANTSTESTPLDIKGLLHYKLSFWNSNTAGNTNGFDNTLRYLPPAPPKFTYTDPGGEGTKDYTVVFSQVSGNNHTTYDSDSLKRTVRYKVNDAADWTYVANDTAVALTTDTTFTVRVPGSQSAVIEGWMSYHGQDSDVKTLNLFNGNAPSRVYGSVNGESVLLNKLYASVNGESKEIVKLYGSVNGEAKAILG